MRRIRSLVLALGLASSILPSGHASSLDQVCSRDSVATLVKAFVRAYNKGDMGQLDSMWANEPDFEWYSVSPGERERDEAYDRETLIPYFEERHQLEDRFRLKALRVGPADARGHFRISYRLHRQSDEQDGSGRYHGKASAKEVMTLPSVDNLSLSRCVLFVWSMGKR